MGVPTLCLLLLALCPDTARYTPSRARAAWTRLRSQSSLKLLARLRALKTHRGGLGPREQTWRWAGVSGLLSGSQTRRSAGEPACTPIGLCLNTWGLPPPCDSLVPGSYPGPDPRSGEKHNLYGTQGSQDTRGPQPRWENEPSLRPAGAFQNHRHTCLHASAKSDAYGQSGQQMTVLSAEWEKSGEGVWGGFRGEGGKGAVLNRERKQTCVASPFVFTLLVSRNQLEHSKPTTRLVFVCLCDLGHTYNLGPNL